MFRPRSEPLFAVAAALLLVSGGVTASLSGGASAQAATTSLCDSQTASVGSGSYIVQNNEYNSSESECVTTNGHADLTVANSSIDNTIGGPPGAYPSIFQGCHWGDCSSGSLSNDPVKVSDLSSEPVTTSWSTTQPGGSSNAYDVAYDIWFNRTRTTSGQPNGTEIMIWLNHDGDVQPFGSEVASDVTIDGNEYDVWEGSQSSWDTVTYEMVKRTTSVSNLNVSDLAEDSVSRGYTGSDWYLIDVEAGFELWQGGAGLATNSFSVTATTTGGGSGSGGGSGGGSGSPSS
jgi:cellulose 1,4-beta-cellobiosidase